VIDSALSYLDLSFCMLLLSFYQKNNRYVERIIPMTLHDATSYGIAKIQAYSALIPKLATSTPSSCNDPNSFKVAVIDSGYDADHQDSPCMLDYKTNPSTNCIGGVFFANPGNMTWDNPNSTAWHGTHVGGVINAKLNGFGYQSVIPDSSGICYIHGRVFDEQQVNSDSFYVYQAVNWAVTKGAKVINMSLGGGWTRVGSDSMIAAQNAGVMVVASMGNGAPSPTVYYPAGYTSTMAVGATDANNVVASYSSYGSHIDVAAPGTAIYSMIPNNKYAGASGTSMSAPFVTGAVVRIWSVCKICPMSVVANCLRSTAKDVNASGFDVYSGNGLIQMEAAYLCMAATPGCCTPLPPPTPAPVAPVPITPAPVTPAPVAVPTLAPVAPTPASPEPTFVQATPVPTGPPTNVPTKAPTKTPTKAPTKTPTKAPTKTPTKRPTKRPTRAPVVPSTCTLKGSGTLCKKSSECCSNICVANGNLKYCA
jgi:hypothetical protein